jgi:hypothetical protein
MLLKEGGEAGRDMLDSFTPLDLIFITYIFQTTQL